jgi:hypothetical protein
MSRKNQLYKIIDTMKPTSILEFGTWNGINAIAMCSVALKHNKEVTYYGIDLFENLDSNTCEAELNVKAAVSIEQVTALFNEFKQSNPGFTFYLIKENSKNVTFENDFKVDLAFIDGGHSVETVEHDYNLVKDRAKCIVFDDYYAKDIKGDCVDTTKYGCNQLVAKINAVVLPNKDPVSLGGVCHLAVTPPQYSPYPINLVVHTQNCVDNEQIHANIRYSTSLIKKWLPGCVNNNKVAVIVSAGPSYLDYIDEIKARQDNGEYIFCVKTNHNDLIERGIIPFGCVLLDPRPKVKRFVVPHKDVKYFAASMVHPSTVDLLRSHDTYLYNAAVGAGEEKLFKQFTDPQSKRIVTNGSTAASRAICVLRILGFTNYVLYGYDSCYKEAQDENETTKNGYKKFWKVDKFGKSFFTSLEMLAQAQDFERIFEQVCGDPTYNITTIGDGMIPHIHSKMKQEVLNFEKVFVDGKEAGTE